MRKKNILREILWLAGTYGVMVIAMLLFSSDNSKSPRTIEFNVHDTYFVIKNTEVFISILIIGFFITYLIRNIFTKFKNKFSSLVGIVSNILLIILISCVISFVFLMKDAVNNIANEELTIENLNPNNIYQSLFWILLIFQIIVCSILVFSAFKVGKNSKQV